MRCTGVPPRATAIEGTGAGSLRVQSQGDQPFHTRPRALPFPPFHAAEFPPQPLVEVFRYWSRFRDAEVARPTAEQTLDVAEECLQIPASSLAELFPEFVFEAFHRLRSHSHSADLLTGQ